MYMGIMNTKRGNILICLAVVFFTALCVACLFLSTNVDVVARAEDAYGVNLTENSVVYNGKPISPKLTVTKNGISTTDYTVAYFKDGVALEGAPKDVGTYTLEVSINNVIPTFSKTFEYTVTPLPLTVIIDGNKDFIYNGTPQGLSSISVVGLCVGDETEIITTYRGDKHTVPAGELPTNADNYDIVFSNTNPNYTIGTIEGITEITIAKRELTVIVKDSTITLGETPSLTYDIIGFIGEEDESALTTLPTLTTNATVVGMHNLRASGGEADNYTFTFKDATLTINGVFSEGSVVGTSTSFDVNGVFSPNTTYTGTALDVKSDEAKEFIERARHYKMTTFASKIALMYQIDVVTGEQLSDKVTISLDNVILKGDWDHIIVVIAPNGVLTQITKYEYLNGKLTFTSPSLGTVLIFRNGYSTVVMYIALCVVVFFIIALIIASKMQYVRDKQDADAKARKNKNKQKYTW